MDGDFDRWNEVKKSVQKNKLKIGVKPREIFWAKIGQNVGDEEYGKGKIFSRPVLIVKQLTSDLFMGIPLTSTLRDDEYFCIFEFQSKKGLRKNSAMILQLRAFSKKRLTNKIGKVSIEDFETIKEKIRNLFPPKA